MVGQTDAQQPIDYLKVEAAEAAAAAAAAAAAGSDDEDEDEDEGGVNTHQKRKRRRMDRHSERNFAELELRIHLLEERVIDLTRTIESRMQHAEHATGDPLAMSSDEETVDEHGANSNSDDSDESMPVNEM